MTKVHIPIKGLPSSNNSKKSEEQLLSTLNSNKPRRCYAKHSTPPTDIHPWPFEQDLESYSPSSTTYQIEADKVSDILNDNKDIANSHGGNVPTKETINNKLCNLKPEATDNEIKEAEKQMVNDFNKVNLAENIARKLSTVSLQKDEFQSITNKMHDIYVAKNHDYGSSFDKTWDKYGINSLLVRLSDKFNRLEALTASDALVKSESIEDTLFDMANYAILGILKLRHDNKR